MAGVKARPNYCFRAPGLLKWIQIVFACIVLGLILYDLAREKNFIEKAKKWAEEKTDGGEDFKWDLHGYIIRGEQYTILVAVVCLIMNLIFLIIFFLSCHTGPCVGCPCLTFSRERAPVMYLQQVLRAKDNKSQQFLLVAGPFIMAKASIYYGASFLIWLAAGGVEVYAAIVYRDDSQDFWKKVKEELGNENYLQECFGRRAAAAAFCFANALLYLGSLQQAKYQDL